MDEITTNDNDRPDVEVTSWCYADAFVSDVDAANPAFMEDAVAQLKKHLQTTYSDVDPTTFSLTSKRYLDALEVQLHMTAVRRPPAEEANGSPNSA